MLFPGVREWKHGYRARHSKSVLGLGDSGSQLTSEVESHKLEFKIITNTALMPTGCAFNPCVESFKIQIIPLKIKAKEGHSNPRSLPENKNAKTSLYTHCCNTIPLAKHLLNPATSLELY